MVKNLYPRSDSISAKVVAPSDFESMFGDFLIDFIVSGFTVSAGSGLDVNVTSGKIRLKGLVVENTVSENVGSLTDNTVNYLYVQLNRDGNSEAEAWDFTTNTTGTLPTDAIKIAKITTSSGAVTAVSQVNQTDVFKYAFLPTGSVQMYAGQYDNIPSGWLLCDGTAISRTTYKDLFDVVGTQFGVGDGSTTFNLPNLIDKFVRGATTSANAGGTGGSDTHTLTSSELPNHSHTISDPGHSHLLDGAYGSFSTADGPQLGVISGTAGTKATQTNTTGITVNSSGGGGQAHNNIPAYLALLYMIRA